MPCGVAVGRGYDRRSTTHDTQSRERHGAGTKETLVSCNQCSRVGRNTRILTTVRVETQIIRSGGADTFSFTNDTEVEEVD